MEPRRRALLGPGRHGVALGRRVRANLSGDRAPPRVAPGRRPRRRRAARDRGDVGSPMTLDDPGLFERTDAHRARDVLAGFPAQCRAALALRAAPAMSLPRPKLVVLVGMGGSAAGAELIAGCAAERLDVPIVVHRGYGLPPTVGKRTLVVASSYSGDTAEVLSAAEAALERAVPMVALTAGGRLGALAAAIPEMNHNEIEAWRAPAAAAMHAVFLRDRDESSEIERRFAVMRELIAAANGDVSECSTRGTGRVARLLGLAYLGAWTSYYVAVGAGTDPWPIPVLDEMKRRLRAP